MLRPAPVYGWSAHKSNSSHIHINLRDAAIIPKVKYVIKYTFLGWSVDLLFPVWWEALFLCSPVPLTVQCTLYENQEEWGWGGSGAYFWPKIGFVTSIAIVLIKLNILTSALDTLLPPMDMNSRLELVFTLPLCFLSAALSFYRGTR